MIDAQTYEKSEHEKEILRLLAKGEREIEAGDRYDKACGFELVGHFTLPDEAWWDDFYTPMKARIAALRGKYAGDALKPWPCWTRSPRSPRCTAAL